MQLDTAVPVTERRGFDDWQDRICDTFVPLRAHREDEAAVHRVPRGRRFDEPGCGRPGRGVRLARGGGAHADADPTR